MEKLLTEREKGEEKHTHPHPLNWLDTAPTVLRSSKFEIVSSIRRRNKKEAATIQHRLSKGPYKMAFEATFIVP